MKLPKQIYHQSYKSNKIKNKKRLSVTKTPDKNITINLNKKAINNKQPSPSMGTL
jgi:hypothetical protein